MHSAPPNLFSRSDVRKHCRREDCWIIIEGVVYDVTEYLSRHPGGSSILLSHAGRDCTDIFNTIHPWVNYKVILKKCAVGCVRGE